MNTHHYKSTLGIVALSAAMLGACGRTPATPTTAQPVATQEAVVEQPDGTRIVVSGTVVSTTTGAFELDYGGGVITVEVDDWDWYDESRVVLVDDQVVVRGRIDRDFLETRSIEAGSVYVASLGTHFFANPADEEEFPYGTPSITEPRVRVTGTITGTDPEGDRFFISTIAGIIPVQTDEMPYDPLDDEGYQQLEIGDRVKVLGVLDVGLFSDEGIEATTVVTLEST